MTTSTLTLTDFLLARIAEDEHLAQFAATTEGGSDWAVYTSGVPDIDGAVGTMPHVVRHDPARVLAECEAKKGIVREYEDAATEARRESPTVSTEVAYVGAALRTALAYLALPYVDHPDYRPEWKP